MATEILMPALSPTMEEGTLAKWLVAPGATVKAGQIIAEIETDKATMEFEAVDEGVIAQILVPEGTQGVKVNTPIAILAADGQVPGDAAADAILFGELGLDGRVRPVRGAVVAAVAPGPGSPAGCLVHEGAFTKGHSPWVCSTRSSVPVKARSCGS